jgi:hypothetical protein
MDSEATADEAVEAILARLEELEVIHYEENLN